jgi:hypothetical protein
MNHLSNKTTIGIMVFYSILTFFLAPYVTGMVMKNDPNYDIIGFAVGFVISVILWVKVGRNYITK